MCGGSEGGRYEVQSIFNFSQTEGQADFLKPVLNRTELPSRGQSTAVVTDWVTNHLVGLIIRSDDLPNFSLLSV